MGENVLKNVRNDGIVRRVNVEFGSVATKALSDAISLCACVSLMSGLAKIAPVVDFAGEPH